MCKLNEIKIQRFRGIKELNLDGLHRVNVLLGNNNCGKSSALEAIMIWMGAAKPSLPIEMNLNRDYNKVQEEDLKLFFHQLDIDIPICISGRFADGATRDLKINYFESKEKNMPISDSGSAEINHEQSLFGLKYNYQDGDEINTSTLTIDSAHKNIAMSGGEKMPLTVNTAFVAPRYNFNDFIKHFNRIVTDKEKENVMEVLRLVDSRIDDITVVGDKVMVDIGLHKLVPINVLGDGIRKMFTLVTAMYSVRDGILLIDEVDNGLYYKTMSVLWQALLKAAQSLDVQLFVSTHSLDSLNALSRTLAADSFSDMRNEVELLTLRRENDDTIISYRYDYDKFSYVLDMEVEIR